MSLTLYYHPLSQPSRAAIALLKLGNINYEGKVVDLMGKENKSPQFLRINPLGFVPAITHNGFSVGQSNALLSYLCDAFPSELQLFKGVSLEERTRVNEYLSWYQGTFRPALVRNMWIRLHLGVMSKKTLKMSEIMDNEKKMFLTLDFLEKHFFKRSEYICGNRMTIADLLIFHETTNVEVYNVNINKWKNIKIWYNKMLSNKVISDIHNQFRTKIPAFAEVLNSISIDHELKLYVHIVSQPCRGAMALLDIEKIPYQQVEVKIFDGEARKPEFLQLNKFATVPALAHGNLHVSESNAIMTYLCQAFPQKLQSYYGRNLAERTQVDELLSWYQGNFRPNMLAIILLRWKHSAIYKCPIKKAHYDEAEGRFKGALQKVDSFLSKGNSYLCGERITIVDILFFHEACNIFLCKIDISPEWVHLKAWFDKMLAMEANSAIIKRYKEVYPTVDVYNEIFSVTIEE